MSETNTITPPEAATCHRESADNYDRVVIVLNDHWRIIECKDGIQWIIQENGAGMAGGRWRNRRYHRLQNTLMAAVASIPVDLSVAQQAIIDRLPHTCGRAQP